MAEFGNIYIRGEFGEKRIYRIGRAYYCNVFLHNGIDAVSFQFARREPDEVITLNGTVLPDDHISAPQTLTVGKNTFHAVLRAEDGSEAEVYLYLFRAYPTPMWNRLIEHAPWMERDSAGEAVFKDRLWIMGGYVPKTVKDIWSSPDGIEWTRHADCPTEAGIDIPVTFVYNDKLYVNDIQDTFWATDGENWEKICDELPWHGGTSKVAGCVYKDKFFVVSCDGVKPGVWSSSDCGRTWETVTTELPMSIRKLDNCMVVFNDKMWILGGHVTACRRKTPIDSGSYYPFIAYNDVWCSEDGKNWECVTENAPWRERYWASVFVYKNRMWIAGGYRTEPANRNFNDVWYSTDGKNWRELKQHTDEWRETAYEFYGGVTSEVTHPVKVPAPMWIDRHEASMLVKDDAVYVIGGMIWPLTNDVWKLKIDGFCFLTQPIFECIKDTLHEYHAFADFAASGLDAKYRIISAPEGFTINETTGRLRGIAREAGEYQVIIEAYTDAGETTRQEYTLDVMDWGITEA